LKRVVCYISPLAALKYWYNLRNSPLMRQISSPRRFKLNMIEWSGISSRGTIIFLDLCCFFQPSLGTRRQGIHELF
jgi:hypothetical protein